MTYTNCVSPSCMSSMSRRLFMVKVHSQCDLSCDYCYVYEAADQSWRSRPGNISDQAAAQVGRRIAVRAVTSGLPGEPVVPHGGEPLLAGHERPRRIITGLHRALDGTCRLDLRIHMNGVRLGAELRGLVAGRQVSVGISLGRDRAANDRHRRCADRSLLAPRPPRIDLLPAHAIWNHPPRRGTGEGLVVIETDGRHEQADSLNVTFDGAPATGMNVPRHSQGRSSRQPGIATRGQVTTGPCQTYQQCPVVSSCGGGLYAHRYRDSGGFAKPQVYCPDLLALIAHQAITCRPTAAIPAAYGTAGISAVRCPTSLWRNRTVFLVGQLQECEVRCEAT